MKLIKLKVNNFRCYRDMFEVSFNDLTAIIGRNDVGKSSLMDALAIFFEEEKIDKSDVCVLGYSNNVQITCVFSDVPDNLVIDESFQTSLRSEYLLNLEGDLEIRKTYDCSVVTPRLTLIEAIAQHPTAEKYSDLLQLKRGELKARAQELGTSLEGIDARANAPVRAAIWQGCNDLALDITPVSLEKEGAKQIWAALAVYMPSFALFKSDRASSDQDAEAQDPLKAAIKDAIKQVEPQLQQIQDHVEAEVRKIAQATVKKVQEMDPTLATTLDPVITAKKWDSLFQTSITGDNGIPLNKRGRGVRRLVLLNFFRATAEKAALEKKASSVIYAIEEPETSQHPHNQRMLMSALMQLAAAEGNQVIVTTHTPMLARGLPEECLRYIEQQDDGGRLVLAGGGNTNARIAASLGVLPDHSVKLFIGVEGKHDINFLRAISKILSDSDKDMPDLEDLEIKGEVIFFPFGGSNLALWASRLSPLNRPEYHICDRDYAPPEVPKYSEHMAAVNARAGCKAVCTLKREMENYIHSDAIREAYADHNITIVLTGAFADFDDVPERVAQAVNTAGCGTAWDTLSDEKKEKKTSKAKFILNSLAASKMTPERLRATDPSNEIINWLRDMQQLMDRDLVKAEAA